MELVGATVTACQWIGNSAWDLMCVCLIHHEGHSFASVATSHGLISPLEPVGHQMYHQIHHKRITPSAHTMYLY